MEKVCSHPIIAASVQQIVPKDHGSDLAIIATYTSTASSGKHFRKRLIGVIVGTQIDIILLRRFVTGISVLAQLRLRQPAFGFNQLSGCRTQQR